MHGLLGSYERENANEDIEGAKQDGSNPIEVAVCHYPDTDTKDSGGEDNQEYRFPLLLHSVWILPHQVPKPLQQFIPNALTVAFPIISTNLPAVSAPVVLKATAS